MTAGVLAVATIPSPVGDLLVTGSAGGVLGLSWDPERPERVAELLAARLGGPGTWLDDVRRQLDEYFAGRRAGLSVAIDWRLTTGFRRSVLQALASRVPAGHTVTYAQLAAVAGHPRAARAVGSAMATNPLPVVVPCHRVLPSAGGLGRYSGAGGVTTKQLLLDLEAEITARPSPGHRRPG